MTTPGAIWSPYLVEPTIGQIKSLARIKGVEEARAFEELHKMRNEIIRKEMNDPLRHGWESPIWWLCDCLLGVPWVDKVMAEKMRRLLGFEQRVRVLLLLGGNRCLGANTEINDPVRKIKQKVSEIKDNFWVQSWDGTKIVNTEAEKPFVKSTEAIYLITLSNGQSFEATLNHQVLGADGVYRRLAECLPLSLQDPMESTLGIYPPIRNVDVQISFLLDHISALWLSAQRLLSGLLQSSAIVRPSIHPSSRLSSASPNKGLIVLNTTTITTIKYLRQDKVYDFNVPKYHNYVCAGIVHHNSSKTIFGLRTMARLQWHEELVKQWNGVRTWSFHMTHQQSVEYHHAIMWNYLPPELRQKQITAKVNISYGQKDGFTRDKYVLPNGSEHSFRNYSQNRSDAIEGGEPNGWYADELVPGDWVETMDMRLATRDGFGVIGFTPIDGYNATVRLFCDGAKVVKKNTAWLLPKDNKESLETRALGLNDAEYAELIKAGEEGRKPDCISCRPEDPRTWLNEGLEPERSGGRVFETVPRVMKCNNGRWGVVYFHSSDNPFGNPAMVLNNIRGKSVAFRRERFYGVAEKAICGKFPLFDEKVHVVETVPGVGTNYLFVDPSSARPFFMLWIRATPEGVYVYREWPNEDPIPQLGCLGTWAEPSGNIQDYDGKKGPAQKNIGWGFLRYKEEIARLERWTSYEAGKPKDMTYEDWIVGMSDQGPSQDKVYERFMDARFGNVSGFETNGMKTLLESFDEVNLNFYETTSQDGKDSIDTGCSMINDALFYDGNQPVSFLNKPKLMFHKSCKNTIFAMQVYTGLDGATGACKDPIDCLRYFYKKNCGYVEQSRTAGTGVAGRGIN